MTQTFRRTPGQRGDVRRKGRVYLFTTLRIQESGPDAGMVLDGTTEDGYVGKTRQTLAQREQQHRGGSADGEPVPGEDLEEQPWWDVTVGGIQLVEQGVWTDDELAERERYWIRQIKPRYNYIDNCANKQRIPKPVAREHRDCRDRAKGLAPRQWQPFSTQRGTAAIPVKALWRSARKLPRLSPRWRRRRNWALGIAGLWLALTLCLWLLDAGWLHAGLAGRTYPIAAAGLAAMPPVSRLRRRHVKPAVVAVVVACAALWLVTG